MFIPGATSVPESRVEILQNFVAFSEYVNFMWNEFTGFVLLTYTFFLHFAQREGFTYTLFEFWAKYIPCYFVCISSLNICSVWRSQNMWKQFAMFSIFVQKKQSTLKLDIVFIIRNQNWILKKKFPPTIDWCNTVNLFCIAKDYLLKLVLGMYMLCRVKKPRWLNFWHWIQVDILD